MRALSMRSYPYSFLYDQAKPPTEERRSPKRLVYQNKSETFQTILSHPFCSILSILLIFILIILNLHFSRVTHRMNFLLIAAEFESCSCDFISILMPNIMKTVPILCRNLKHRLNHLLNVDATAAALDLADCTLKKSRLTRHVVIIGRSLRKRLIPKGFSIRYHPADGDRQSRPYPRSQTHVEDV